jgi:hypothetical protein
MAEHRILSKPLCINIWIERGTVIPLSGAVIEPLLMWRDVYQPELTDRRKLNQSTQKPWSIRLLDTCRISNVQDNLNRSTYPLARKNCSFFLRTCTGQELLLEASSQEERDNLCQRLKLAVARFASLAVTEDIDQISKEFFHSKSLSIVGNSPV